MKIVHLTEIAQFQQVVSLQREIWHMTDLETQPTDTFVVAQATGGASFGALEDDRLVGFSLGLPGVKKEGASYLHSHMLGVLPQYTNRGFGRALKVRQREWALSRGYELIEWTFDPLQVKNAFFNIEKLGAVVRRCHSNFYGTTSNTLDAGLPTDRCVAEWWLRSPRVTQVIDDHAALTSVAVDRLQVPGSIQSLRTSDPKAARDLQRELMNALSKHFSQGLALIGVERHPDSTTYLIGTIDQPTNYRVSS